MSGTAKLQYFRMQQASVDAFQAEVQALIEREAAAGADGRDICQAIVEAVAGYAMAVVNDPAEIKRLADHMTQVAIELETP